jgi:hypothetical protein
MRLPTLALLGVGGFLSAAIGDTKTVDAKSDAPAAPCLRMAEIKDGAAVMSADQKAALASFQAMLDGLGKRDKAAMQAQLLPGGGAVLMRNGKPVQMTLEMLADRVSQPGKETHEERIHDAIVHVDGDVAIVWAPFEFLVDGKIDHCGRDIANMVRVDDRWLVAAIEDNGRKDCGGR